MINFNEELLQKIRSAFKPATLDFSEESQPFLVYDDYMLFKADQAVCIHLFEKIRSTIRSSEHDAISSIGNMGDM